MAVLDSGVKASSWPKGVPIKAACGALGRSRAGYDPADRVFKRAPATVGAVASRPTCRGSRRHRRGARQRALLRPGASPGLGDPLRRGHLPGLYLDHVPPAAGAAPGP